MSDLNGKNLLDSDKFAMPTSDTDKAKINDGSANQNVLATIGNAATSSDAQETGICQSSLNDSDSATAETSLTVYDENSVVNEEAANDDYETGVKKMKFCSSEQEKSSMNHTRQNEIGEVNWPYNSGHIAVDEECHVEVTISSDECNEVNNQVSTENSSDVQPTVCSDMDTYNTCATVSSVMDFDQNNSIVADTNVSRQPASACNQTESAGEVILDMPDFPNLVTREIQYPDEDFFFGRPFPETDTDTDSDFSDDMDEFTDSDDDEVLNFTVVQNWFRL